MAAEHLNRLIQQLRHRFRMAEFYATEKCQKQEAAVYRKLLDESQDLILRGRLEAALGHLEISDEDLRRLISGKPRRSGVRRGKQHRKGGQP